MKQLRAVVLLGALGSLTLSLSACAPPPKPGASTNVREGHEIIQVAKKTVDPFKTVEVDGVEMLQGRGEPGQYGGTFYDIQIGDGPKTFNPWTATDATSSAMGDSLTPGLVSTDVYTGEVVPYLAKSITLAPDKLTYTVVMRKGLTWSDGKPLTAKDVVFTWNEIVKPGLGNASLRDINTINGKFPEVKLVDDLTIVFKTPEPFAPFMRNLSVNIAPEHIFKPIIQKSGPKGLDNSWITMDAEKHPEKFVASGMWILDKYSSVEKKVVFKRNPNFFMVDSKGQRLPYLDRYVLSFVGDQNNEHLQFEQGKSDSYSIPGDKLSLTRKMTQPDFSIYNLGPTTGTTFLTFNLNTRKDPKTGKPIVDPIKSSWFTKTEFRQAVDYAINREDIVANILKGVGAPLFTAESLPSIFLNQKLAKGHPQNIQEAKALLKKAGFQWDGQGKLMDAAGHPVEFTLYTNSGNNQREATGVNIKEDLTELGMKVNFKPIDFNVLGGKIQDGSWEAMIMGLTGGTLEPNMGANVWKSDGFIHMFNQREIPTDGKLVNVSDRFPWEKDLDQIFADGVRVFDFNERKKIYDRYQEIVYQQQPFIYLFSGLQMIAVRNHIKNFDPTPLGAFHNMEMIWLDDAKRPAKKAN